MTQTAIPCVLIRGGTSKGLYFHAADLPLDRVLRDRVLLAALGSPDPRQIDGLGGAHPLTSKVAIISRSQRDDADVDYLFLQVVVDKPEVSESQNCGNILAGVGPFAIEQGLVRANNDVTDVRIGMLNTGGIAVARVQTPGGSVAYEGSAEIDGVPGTAAAVTLDFEDVSGGSCGDLLPTGHARNRIDGIDVTCIDNGMPVVLLKAADFGKTGYEAPRKLEADTALTRRIEAIRLELGPTMNLGEVGDKTVPKMTLIAPPIRDGVISTRTFIPHRVHEAIGVLGAVSVATACLIPGSVAYELSELPTDSGACSLDIEHPGGFFTVEVEIERDGDGVKVTRSVLLRTARKLMQGSVFVPASIWSGS
jgi:4-oxalomesaconate tautomerase